MRQFIQKINNLTISFILIFVYFFGIGLAALLYILTNKKKPKNTESYWQNNEKKPLDIKSFESPY